MEFRQFYRRYCNNIKGISTLLSVLQLFNCQGCKCESKVQLNMLQFSLLVLSVAWFIYEILMLHSVNCYEKVPCDFIDHAFLFLWLETIH